MPHPAAPVQSGLLSCQTTRSPGFRLDCPADVLRILLVAVATAVLCGCETIESRGRTADDPVTSLDRSVLSAGVESTDTILARARELHRTGHSAEALPLLAELLRRPPEASQQNQGVNEPLPVAASQGVQEPVNDDSQTIALELLVDVTRELPDWRLHQAALKRLAERHPDSATIQNRVGRLLIQSVQMEAATRPSCEPTESPDSGHTSPLVPSGLIREAGLKALYRAAQLEPRNETFTLELVSALLDQRRDAEAERVLIASLRENPQNQQLPMVAARFFETRQNWNGATHCYNLALRNSPGNRIWRRQRAMCRYRLEQYEEACDDFRRSLHGTPVRRQLTEFIAWGDAALKAGHYSEARRILDRLVNEGETRTADLELLRTVCRLRLGKRADAQAILNRARHDWPEHSGLRNLESSLRPLKAAAHQSTEARSTSSPG